MTLLQDRFSFRVRWVPFLLRPQCPLEGLPTGEPKGGDMTNPRVVHLKETGQKLGLDFTFECPIYPYTVPAHVLLEYAKLALGGDLQNNTVERLFRAYFTKGRPLQKKHLLQVAKDLNFDLQEVEDYLADPENEVRVKEKAQSWRDKGIDAIPFFIINGESAGSGAQEVDEFIRLIVEMAEKYPSNVSVAPPEADLAGGETPL